MHALLVSVTTNAVLLFAAAVCTALVELQALRQGPLLPRLRLRTHLHRL
jgi:hypothetical protein